MTELTPFAQGLAREVTTECETYTNYATSSVVNLLMSDQNHVSALKNFLELAFTYTPEESLPYLYARWLESRFEEYFLPEEDDRSEIENFAYDQFLMLVDWKQIAEYEIIEYKLQQENN